MGLLRDTLSSMQETNRTRSHSMSGPPPYSSSSSPYVGHSAPIEPIHEQEETNDMVFDSSSLSSSSSSVYSSPSSLGYVDNYVEGDVQIFGPEVERAKRHNSVRLPITKHNEYYGRLSDPVVQFPPQFQKQVNTRHLYTPFRPILVVANSPNLVEGFQMVYFPEQLGSHDISSSDWQRFLEDLRRAAMPTSSYAYGNRYNRQYNSGYGQSNGEYRGVLYGENDRQRMLGGSSNNGRLSSVLDNRLNGRRRGGRYEKDDGLVRSVLKLGAAYIDGKSSSNSTYNNNNLNTDDAYFYAENSIPRTINSDDYDNLSSFIDRWNMMFFNNRSVHVQIRFPHEVKKEYDHFLRTYSREDGRKVRRQAEHDGPDSLKKCRLIITSL
ncbi:hypothetical protein CLIB1423_28S00562 [[Candida] railenensis]|uniref:Uncharacterized protein n=1 Tax=[Candida] railenensis TaxID=45579 RepID=A0A9P0W104_9ASCO|nr:hypothetical protein CLIB1423_28S00562 [[Candida] railenensis]